MHLQYPLHRRYHHEATTDGASVRLLETVREAEAKSECVLVFACRHLGGECLPPHDHAHALIVCCNGAAREAPTDGASVRLLETVREAEADSQCVFVSACRHSGGECLPPHDHAPALIVCCNGAAVKLRLMEQACGC